MPFRPRILVIDDNAASQEILSGFLQQHGYVVDLAGCGLGGLTRLQGFRPHCVVLDLCLPGCMEGREFINTIRSDPRWHWLPVVIASAASEDAINTALEDGRRWAGGAVVALRKPFEPEELLAALRAMIPERIPLPEKYPPEC